MAAINKHGNKWRVEIRRKGLPYISQSFTLKSDAVKWAKAEELRLEQGGTVVTATMKRVTVKDMVNDFEANVLPTRKSPDWYTSACRRIQRDFPELCACTPDMDMTAQLESLIQKRTAEGVSPNTVRADLVLLHSIFKHAQKKMKIRFANGKPTDNIEWPDEVEVKHYKVWDKVTYESLLVALNFDLTKRPKTNAEFLPWFIALVRETGLRPITLLRIKPEDVDLDTPCILCKGETVKNGETYRAPLNKRSVEILRALLPFRVGCERLLEYSVDGYGKAFREEKKRFKEDFPKLAELKLYGLRHTWTTETVAKFPNPIEMLKVSGRRDMQTLIDTYYQPQVSDLAKRLG